MVTLRHNRASSLSWALIFPAEYSSCILFNLSGCSALFFSHCVHDDEVSVKTDVNSSLIFIFKSLGLERIPVEC